MPMQRRVPTPRRQNEITSRPQRGGDRFALVRMLKGVRRDLVSSMSKDNFEWDDAKREDNLKRHRIDFHDVPALFDGPFLLRSSIRRGEHRLLAIGFING